MSQRGGSGCGGGGSNEISAHFVGPLELSDALAHYAKQLQAAGWRLGAPLGNATVTLASAEAKDSESKAWTGTLMVTRVSPSELEVTIRMARPSDR
jgi:membrane-bound lytic murein transglycosylase B